MLTVSSILYTLCSIYMKHSLVLIQFPTPSYSQHALPIFRFILAHSDLFTNILLIY